MAKTSEDERAKAERLYYRYRNLMFYIANKILNNQELAEDAVQETMAKLIKNLHKADENNPARAKSYIAKICRNTALSMWSKRSGTVSYDDIDEELLVDNINGSVEAVVIFRETRSELSQAIKDLPEIYRDVFLMKRVQNHSRAEISNILEINIETVKKRLTRATQKVKSSLNRGEKNA